MREDSMRQFLNQEGYEIVWLISGQKDWLGSGGPGRSDEFLGRLYIQGAYQFANGQIRGKLRTRFAK
jgi:hypothetical protein